MSEDSVKNHKFDGFSLELRFAEEKLKLFVNVIAEGRIPTLDQVNQALKSLMPKLEADQAVLQDMLTHITQENSASGERRIAKGEPAQDGDHGRLLFLVLPFKGQLERDRTRLFDNILIGQTLARIYPAKAGKDGVTAAGEVISAKAGNALTIEVEEGLQLEKREQFEEVLAKGEGALIYADNTLSLTDTIRIPASIDRRIGSIDFIGKVIVDGDVNSGFRVAGKKGVEIKGAAREAIIESGSGDVEVKGFYFGGEVGGCKAGGKIKLFSAQELEINAFNQIEITKDVRECQMTTQMNISAEQAQMIGGKLLTVNGGVFAEFGNSAGIATEIELASSVVATGEYQALIRSIAEHEKIESLISLNLGQVERFPSLMKKFSSEHQQKMKALIEKKESVKKSKVQLLAKKAELLASNNEQRTVSIKFKKTLHAGVRVKSADLVYDNKEVVNGPKALKPDFEAKEFKICEFQDG